MTLSNVFPWQDDCILIKISLKIVSRGPIGNKSAINQVMAWHEIGDKSLLKPMLTEFQGLNQWEVLFMQVL